MGTGFAKKKKEQRAMQEQLKSMQASMETAQAEGTAGNGLVRMTLNGSMELMKLTIQKECVDPEDVEGLVLLIRAAHEDARQKIQQQAGSLDPSALLGQFGF